MRHGEDPGVGQEASASQARPNMMAAEHWLAAIVESSDDAIVGETLEGIITSWNSGATRIFGYTADEVIGKPITSLVWPGDEEQIEILLQRMRRGERVDHFRAIRRHKNGHRVLISLSLSPILDEDRTVVGIAKIARDITDRVAMEQSLSAIGEKVRLLTEREAEAQALILAEGRFRDLIEKAPDGILQVDGSGVIVIANRTAQELFGYSAAELIGANVDMLVPSDARGGHAAHRQTFLASGATRPMGLGAELFARRKDGSQFPVEISLSPTDLKGKRHVTAVVRDVTERKRTEQHLKTLQESYMAELEARQVEADRVNRSKSEFLAGITHELRTPLHTIIGFSDLLKEELGGPLNDAQRGFVNHIRRDSDHLLKLINDVLDLSRIEAGGLQLHPEPLRIIDAVTGALSAIRLQAQSKGIRVECVVPDDLVADADPTRVRQVLYNLLSNALKFTPGGGTVTVSAGEDGAFFYVSVRDTGVGIPANEQTQVFDRFYQVGPSVAGAGLGLAICKQLVELQGGKISLRSEPGKGSEFTFTLRKAL